MAAGKPYKVVHHSGATVCVVSHTKPRYFICPILIYEQSFFTRYKWPCCDIATVCTASQTFEGKTTSGQFQVNSFNEMTDCNNNVVKQSVSRSLVLQLTRGQADSLCVIYEVFDCVSVFAGVGWWGGRWSRSYSACSDW